MTTTTHTDPVTGHGGPRKSVLTCRGLQFGYGEPLCEPLDWEVGSGEIWAIAGGNGCGKTTLMRTVLGFLRPLGGRVELTRSRSYVSQHTDLQAVPARVAEVVVLGLETGLSGFMPFYRLRHRKDVEELLGVFELAALRDRSIHEISPGERQRTMLAMSIVRRPEIIFLDEATSAMDPRHTHDSFASLVRFAAAGDSAVVAISHSLYAQLDLVTHLLVFVDGRYDAGPVAGMLKKHPEIRHAGKIE